MANKIVLKKSSVAAKVPLSTDLEVGEIAVNLVDQKLYSKKADGTVVLVGTGSGGAGDVTGAASSTDNAVVRFDGTTGKVIQNSSVIIDDSNNVSGVATLNAANLIIADNATLGSSNTDTVAVNGRITTDLDPNTTGSHDIGSSGRNWRDGFFSRNLAAATLNATDVNANSAIISANSSTNALRITQIGSGNALLVEDEANPDATPTVIDSAGKLGIGIATPTANLHINNSTATGNVFLIDALGGSFPNFVMQGNGEQTFRFNNTAATGSTRVSWKMADRIDPDWRWIMYTDLLEDGAESFTIRGITSGHVFTAYEGKVGVGTASPSAKFDVVANTTYNALKITQTGTGNALVVEDSANPDATPFVIDSSGRAFFGSTTFIQTNTYSNLEPLSIFGLNGIGMQLADFGANQFASGINFAKSRSGTVGTGVIVNNGDDLGSVIFNGYDGAAYKQAAFIKAVVDGTPGTNDMPGRLVFSTTADGASSPTEAMRIRSDRNIGFGGVGSASISFNQQKSITGAINAFSHAITATVLSDVTNVGYGYYTGLSTAAASFTLNNLRHYTAFQNALGAGSTVTNQFGFQAGSSLIGATNNYGFYSDIASGTGRWNFYAAGSAANYFAGIVLVGTASSSNDYRVDIAPQAAGAALRVRGGSGGSAIIQFTDSAISTQWGTVVATSADLRLTHNAIIRFDTNSAERMRITNAGNVGIGTNSPGSRLAVNGSITESSDGTNYFPVVTQQDIGTAPNEIPLNQYLGDLAYQDANSVVIKPVASATPAGIGDMVFQLTSDTSLVIKVKGSDGTVRSATLTLA